MPAFTYAAAFTRVIAAVSICSRSVGSSPGAGATSTTFWWRNWTEQSRSCRWTTLPDESARIWTSMCLGRAISLSRKTAPSPNAAWASLQQRSKASAICSALSTTRIPRPPPPAAALSITGYPRSWASFSASRADSMGLALPGTTGMSSDSASVRALTLSPNKASVSGDGPINATPSAAHNAAKAAFSDKKP